MSAAVPETPVVDPIKNPGGLPLDLWGEIYRHLPNGDLLRARQVCRGFRDLDFFPIHRAALERAFSIRRATKPLHPATQMRRVSSISPVRGDSRFLLDVSLHSVHLHSSGSKIEIWSGTQQMCRAHRAFRLRDSIRILLCHIEELWDGEPIPEDYDPLKVVRNRSSRLSLFERRFDLKTNSVSAPLQVGPTWEAGHEAAAMKLEVDGAGDWTLVADGSTGSILVYHLQSPAQPAHKIGFHAVPLGVGLNRLLGAISEPFGFAYREQGEVRVWRARTDELVSLGPTEGLVSTGPDCWTLSSRRSDQPSRVVWNGERRWLSEDFVQQCSYLIPLDLPGSFVAQGEEGFQGFHGGMPTWQVEWDWNVQGRALFVPIGREITQLLYVRETYMGQHGTETNLYIMNPDSGSIKRVEGWCGNASPLITDTGLYLAEACRADGTSDAALGLYRLTPLEPSAAEAAAGGAARS